MAFAVVVLHLGLSEQHIAYESLNMNVLLDKNTNYIHLMINLMEIAISKYIVHLMVPCFFMVSGYLFFKKITFNISTYTAKVQSRFHSIAMPYIYWNILYLLFLLSMKMLGVIFHGNDVRGIVLFLEEHGWIKLLWNSQILSSISIFGKEIYHYFPVNAPFCFSMDL